ncbi:hypothetical protein [Demequina litorisediminis]|uniref:hypothetical protein n=1 Tax=Demequina litorisediminis TaxID=1849022 RepID=UPI0024E15957|nr:hypothetical protein [Demequina litorisediminis]
MREIITRDPARPPPLPTIGWLTPHTSPPDFNLAPQTRSGRPDAAPASASEAKYSV